MVCVKVGTKGTAKYICKREGPYGCMVLMKVGMVAWCHDMKQTLHCHRNPVSLHEMLQVGADGVRWCHTPCIVSTGLAISIVGQQSHIPNEQRDDVRTLGMVERPVQLVRLIGVCCERSSGSGVRECGLEGATSVCTGTRDAPPMAAVTGLMVA